MLIAVTACGGAEENGGTNRDTNDGSDRGAEATVMKCYGTEDGCSTATQFCLVSKMNGVDLAGTCANLPTNCTSCDCAMNVAESEWKRLTDNTNNCTGALQTCSASNTEITVTCRK
ncbi:MAG: hypothetical protein WBV82_17500 [Myxococcaceae bacterium]